MCQAGIRKLPKPPTMGSFGLILIRAKTNTIIFDCLLSGTMVRPQQRLNPFYVVGTERTPVKVAASATNCKTAKDPVNFQDPEETFAYVLVHSRSPGYFNYVLLNRNDPTPSARIIDHNVKTKIYNTRQDMVFFGTRRPNRIPDSIHAIQNEFLQSNTRDTFLELSRTDITKGTSLIRCSVSAHGFEPKSFHVSSRSTPMKPNPCDDATPLFSVTPVTELPLPQDLNDPLQTRPTSTLPEVTDQFERWMQDIRAHHANSLDVAKVASKEVRPWFHWNKNSQNRQLSSFTCRMCSHIIFKGLVVEREHGENRDRLLSITGSPVEKPSGSSSKSIKSRNNDIIVNHMKNPIHQIAEFFFGLVNEGNDATAIKKKLLEPSSPFRKYYGPTEISHLMTITAVKTRTPFNSFPLIPRLLERCDVDPGAHFKTKDGMKAMVMSIGNLIHQNLLQYLQSNPGLIISILVDTASDLTSEDHISLRIQFCDSRLRVFNMQYGFIKVGSDASGATLFDLVKNRFLVDGMEDYMKGRILSINTDGAPAMLVTFVDAVKEFAENNVFNVHCLNHR